MGIGDAILTSSCLAGTMLALPAILIFFNVVLIETSEKTVQRLQQGGCIPFIAGVGILLIIGGPAVLLLSIGSVFQFIGGVIITILLAGGFIGLGAVARLIGRRLTDMAPVYRNPLIETLAGAFTLAFALAFPLLGWFVLLPLSFITGIGAVLLVLIRMYRPSSPPAPPPPAPEPVHPPNSYEYRYEPGDMTQ